MKTRILVVDDEESILIALRGLLKRDGHDVVVASSGDQSEVSRTIARPGDCTQPGL